MIPLMLLVTLQDNLTTNQLILSLHTKFRFLVVSHPECFDYSLNVSRFVSSPQSVIREVRSEYASQSDDGA